MNVDQPFYRCLFLKFSQYRTFSAALIVILLASQFPSSSFSDTAVRETVEGTACQILKRTDSVALDTNRHEIDLGTIRSGSRIKVETQLTTPPRSDWTISEIKKSCGCISSVRHNLLDENPKRFQLQLTLDPKIANGTRVSGLTIISHDEYGSERNCKLELTVRVKPSLELRIPGIARHNPAVNDLSIDWSLIDHFNDFTAEPKVSTSRSKILSTKVEMKSFPTEKRWDGTSVIRREPQTGQETFTFILGPVERTAVVRYENFAPFECIPRQFSITKATRELKIHLLIRDPNLERAWKFDATDDSPDGRRPLTPKTIREISSNLVVATLLLPPNEFPVSNIVITGDKGKSHKETVSITRN